MKTKNLSTDFKHWLQTSGYDIGLQDELMVDEHAWGCKREVDLFKLVAEWGKDLLTEYTDFLVKHGYCDTDVYYEPPSTIDRFLVPQLRDK